MKGHIRIRTEEEQELMFVVPIRATYGYYMVHNKYSFPYGTPKNKKTLDALEERKVYVVSGLVNGFRIIECPWLALAKEIAKELDILCKSMNFNRQVKKQNPNLSEIVSMDKEILILLQRTLNAMTSSNKKSPDYPFPEGVGEWIRKEIEKRTKEEFILSLVTLKQTQTGFF